MEVPAQEKFRCETTESTDDQGRMTSTVKCYGRFVAGNTDPLREAVVPLLSRGGRVVIDCSEVAYMDSMGLGAIVALKVSSVHKGSGTLEFVNLTPRIKELLRLTKLTEYLARPDTINYGD